jgi:hypothetical protein
MKAGGPTSFPLRSKPLEFYSVGLYQEWSCRSASARQRKQ